MQARRTLVCQEKRDGRSGPHSLEVRARSPAHLARPLATGVSNDGVTDRAHYRGGRTSRILNIPCEDEEAYRLSSPIYYAEGLEDPLLIVHSIIDDNVHFQDAARLVQRLIELERDFEVMFYPLECHNFAHVASRLDYYRRVAELFGRELLR